MFALLACAARPALTAGAPGPSWFAYLAGTNHVNDTARAVTVDAGGNTYVTGTADSGFLTAKYDPSGSWQWSARYRGNSSGVDRPVAIAVDGAGNVVVVGSSFGGTTLQGGTDYDYAVVKYDPAGHQLWAERYNGPGNGEDEATGLVLDSGGNAYVTGYSWANGTAWDYATIKYSAQGELQWVARYDGTGGADYATAIALDGSGNVIVTGSSSGGSTDFDCATIKYDPNGVPAWVKRYDGAAHGPDGATAIAVDAADDVYVTGSSLAVAGSGNSDYVTLKYDTAGNLAWSAGYDGPAHGVDIPAAIAVAPDQTVRVTGQSWGGNSGFDYSTVAYSASGVQLWAARYDGPAGQDDAAVAVGVDSVGNTYVTGGAAVDATNDAIVTVKYAPDGTVAWVNRFAPSWAGSCDGNAMAMFHSQFAVVAGFAWAQDGTTDFATLALPIGPPTAPSGLTAAVSSGHVALQWVDNGVGETGFLVERSVGSGSFSTLTTTGPTVVTYTDTAVSPGNQYTYRVRAMNGAGPSGPSNAATVLVPSTVPGRIAASPAQISFGNVRVGKSKSKTVRIKNTGKGALTGQISLPGVPFSGTGGGAFVLPARGSLTVSVKFAPATAGTASATLGIQCDDPAHPQVSIPITGKGL